MTTWPLPGAGLGRPSPVRFLRGLAARTALLAAAIVGLNLVVDPLGLYGSRVLEPIGSQTQRDKLLLFEQAQPAPAVVVLGSSRSFYVEPAHIRARTSLPAFNAATSGAGAGDYLRHRPLDHRPRAQHGLKVVAEGVAGAFASAAGLDEGVAVGRALALRRHAEGC